MINTRYEIIERVIRKVYGEQPNNDASITNNLVNKWIEDGIAAAAKLNYKESIQLDGIGYVNNSFYLTFKNITFTQDEQFQFIGTLPQIPLGIGKNQGISSLRIKDNQNNISYDVLPLSEDEWTFARALPPIPNKLLYKPEGRSIYVLTTLLLNIGYTATASMISSGDDTNLDSVLNVPQEYIPAIIEYCSNMLMQERQVPKDVTNDGADN